MLMSRRFHDREQGAVAIVVALSSVLLIGIGALAVDIGQLYSVRRESQRTADLAALAGGQDLPNAPLQACIDALSYLDKNKPGGGGYGISPTTCTTTGTSDGKTIKIYNKGLNIDVKVPDQQVNLGLAAVFGYSKGYTAAGATVEVRSPGRILPFGLTLCRTTGFVTVKTSSHTDGTCGDTNLGDFGFLDIPRTGVTQSNTRLELNINKGIDHSDIQFAPWPDSAPSPTIAPGTECKDIPNTTPAAPIIDPTGATPVEGANCLDIDNGNKAAAITDGLIESTNNACDGRLTRVRAGAATMSYGGCTIDNDSFLTFLTAGNLAQAAAGTLPAGAISQDIVDSPNFFFVPVINSVDHPQNGYYPIVDFRGFYLECFGDGTQTGACPQATSGQITQLQGYAFSLDALPAVAADTGETSIYLGGGTRVPVLVK